ncbi:type III secretion system inner rod subunit SctI [Pseudomonas chlororaphis subsp. aurantiaca]|uniref:type III secretion system inner rod subunit SctI n=1 Tax=Pseudomonas chlororaphis TaxID=587753 RepID=UPI0027DCF59F|nr:type III secretion system inner rod subunit SctI [Pseudomonas chlororaphis]WMI97543.1 type III secretion system inner rod subunit SctI [Pseudomonas chlororaphis subsp. aurantiaca]
MSTSSLVVEGVNKIRIAQLARPAPTAVISLEDQLIKNYANAAVGVQLDQTKINAMLRRPDITNPEVLSELQIRTAQYNIDVSLLNVLVRKSVTTAETLLRSS